MVSVADFPLEILKEASGGYDLVVLKKFRDQRVDSIFNGDCSPHIWHLSDAASD